MAEGAERRRGIIDKVLATLIATAILALVALIWRQVHGDAEEPPEVSSATIVREHASSEPNSVPLTRERASSTATPTEPSASQPASLESTTTHDSRQSSIPTGGPTPLVLLEPVTSSSWFDSDEVMIDGSLYTEGWYSGVIGGCASSYRNSTQTVEFSIGRAYERFSSVVGVTDDSDAGVPIKVEIAVDGSVEWSEVVQVGQPREVDLSVANALRLSIVATQQLDDDAGCVYAALGNPTLA